MSAQMVPSVPNLLPSLENKDLSPWLSEAGLSVWDNLTMYPICTESSLSLEDMPSISSFNTTCYSPNIWTEPGFGNKKVNFDLDGLNSGIPTRTTPTITPTTLRIIDEDFMQHIGVEEHEKQGFFVPPDIIPVTTVTQANGNIHIADHTSWNGGLVKSEQQSAIPAPQPGASLSSCPTPRSSTPGSRCDTPPQTQPTRRNVGGRRPIKEKGISPEEEERRQVRRERNKLAAARCRKRRIDHTNELLQETEALEDRKNGIQAQIAELQAQKEELEMILAAHTPCCRLNQSQSPSPNSFLQQDKVSFLEQNKICLDGITIRIKQEPESIPISEPSSVNVHKRVALGNSNRPRPTSLPVSTSPFMSHPKHQSESRTNPSPAPLLTDMANIPISTPSSGMPLNFESLMNGGTGLTPQGPLAPTCSSQQRNGDLPTPENGTNKRMLSL